MVFQNMQCYGNMHTNSIVSSMFAKVYRRVYSKVVINKILVFFFNKCSTFWFQIGIFGKNFFLVWNWVMREGLHDLS